MKYELSDEEKYGIVDDPEIIYAEKEKYKEMYQDSECVIEDMRLNDNMVILKLKDMIAQEDKFTEYSKNIAAIKKARLKMNSYRELIDILNENVLRSR